MKNLFNVTAQYCANFLGAEMIGDGSLVVRQFSNLDDNAQFGIRFANAFSDSNLVSINSNQTGFLIAALAYSGKLSVPHVLSKNPRLDFIRLMNHLIHLNKNSKIEQSATIGKNVSLGNDVCIGCNVVIEDNVTIGEGTVIRHGVVIASGTHIGKHCFIKPGTVIGEKGFGFERDESGRPLPFIHLGGVTIGDFVELGALNTVVAGALSPTVIEDYVKTDDHVHIAHNVKIGQRSLVTAAVEISGSVKIGDGVWLGPNCSLMDKIEIGDNSFIGIGAVVTKSVARDSVVVGNPARFLAGNSARFIRNIQKIE